MLMPRIKLIVALIVSVTLVGAAFWFKQPQGKDVTSANLLPVLSPTGAKYQEALLKTFSESSPENLSATDMVARQLFSDYVQLDALGQTTTDNFNDLASGYAESIVTRPLPTPRIINSSDVKIVADTEENLAQYGQSMLSIRAKYKQMISAQNNGGNMEQIENGGLESIMKIAEELYQASAQEILNLAVPVSLLENHVAIVNTYFENVEAAKIISQISTDPISAYSAISVHSNNSQKEEDLFLNIRIAMLANGITGQSI